MTRVVSLGLVRAIQRHAAASRRADAAPALGDAEVDAAAEEEHAAAEGLGEALACLGSADDVAAVIAHAYDQGGRGAEPGAQGAVLLMLSAALARRAFGGPAAA